MPPSNRARSADQQRRTWTRLTYGCRCRRRRFVLLVLLCPGCSIKTDRKRPEWGKSVTSVHTVGVPQKGCCCHISAIRIGRLQLLVVKVVLAKTPARVPPPTHPASQPVSHFIVMHARMCTLVLALLSIRPFFIPFMFIAHNHSHPHTDCCGCGGAALADSGTQSPLLAPPSQ